jgi:hypothetical protein
MSIATNNLKLAHAEFQRRKQAEVLRALWDVAKDNGGLSHELVPYVLAIPGVGGGPEAFAMLRLALARGHLIEVRRHTPGGVATVYCCMGLRP